MTDLHDLITRRQALTRATAGGAALALSSQALLTPAGATGQPVVASAPAAAIPLPSPAQVRADFQRMVDFGPRLTGNDNHNAYIAWLEQELVSAGVELLPCSSYELTRWSVGQYGLEVLSGGSPGPVRVATYYPRSQETPPEGITAPLVYGGTAPAPSFSSTNVAALAAGIAAYPAQLETWAQALPDVITGRTVRDSILVVDLPLPAPLTTGVFLELATYPELGRPHARRLGHGRLQALVGDARTRRAALPVQRTGSCRGRVHPRLLLRGRQRRLHSLRPRV